MTVSVTFRNTEGDNWQKEYVEERLKKLTKYVDNPAEFHVVLSLEKFRNVAEINLLANGVTINAKEEEKDMHLAIDNAILKIERQLKKHKEKIRGHKNNSIREEIGKAGEILTDELEDLSRAKVVEVRNLVLKPMSLDDALLEIKTTKNRFVVYRDSATESINVVYRREDGRYALIETEG